MKIGVISDLHLSKFEHIDDFVEPFIKCVIDKRVDLLIIDGDIYEDCFVVIDFINRLRAELGIDVYYVYGNHDIWNNNNLLCTDDIIKIYNADSNCLVGKEIKASDYTIIGHMLWYDFSLSSGDFSYDELVAGKYRDMHWKDSDYIHFDDYVEVTKTYNEQVMKQIEANENVILVTHMINDESFVQSVGEDDMWRFYNGYLGSVDGFKLAKHKNVKIAICGHIHMRKIFEKDGTKYICSCFENMQPKDRENREQMYEEISKSLYVFDI